MDPFSLLFLMGPAALLIIPMFLLAMIIAPFAFLAGGNGFEALKSFFVDFLGNIQFGYIEEGFGISGIINSFILWITSTFGQ